MAYYDLLTGLPNRALFQERLWGAIGAVDAGAAGFVGVMMIDMDRFKGVNDTLGHAMGDELLREAAERLRQCVRHEDTVDRLGGDEFAIVAPNLRTPHTLVAICESIVERFDEHFQLEGSEVVVSCSIGVAQYPLDCVEGEDLLKYADLAMYQAKRSGNRGFCFYSSR